MRHLITGSLVVVTLLTGFEAAAAKRRKVVVRGPRVRVTVRQGFPIRRTLPQVVVRPAPVVRVTARTYLPAVAFRSVAVAAVAANARAWSDDEELDREDGWTDFTLNVNKRGSRLLLQIEEGAAQISFAEVVFDNGEAQVIDFNDKVQSRGVYSLLDFRDGRKVDHVRVVARATSASTEITLHLVS
jgi:hypothetical protein